ncbi:unnamed protein product [Candidula unifasciata]|uniref:Ammonium transporter n=1 Tax=Candidula unifasciata TaxID=100452 RepID=A0A8S3ZC41_9EUPU|nr:unnamed protein product [Candidula unifasciata]
MAENITKHFTATDNNTNAKNELEKSLDQFFLIIMGIIVLMMQCGFAFLEAGSVRSKNTTNLLMKNMLDSFVAGIAYWTLGFAFAHGEGNSFMGWEYFASSSLPNSRLAFFFFHYVFAATAATIVSGALAERCEMLAYFVYSFVITAFVYPVVTHWVWHPDGWLRAGLTFEVNNMTLNISFHDFSGGCAIHCLGGTAAFFGALFLGPRIGRFHEESKTVLQVRGHSLPFTALGGFILLFGFLAFNAGSQSSLSKPGDGTAMSVIVVNTVIAGSTSGFVTLLVHRIGILGRTWSLLSTMNGALSGMVAVCSGCNVYRPWAAPIVGAFAGVSFNLISWLMCRFKIDDPVDAVAVHFGGGVWGVLAVAFLKYESGILMSWNMLSALLLAWQLVGLISIVAWTAAMSSLVFGTLKLTGTFRVSADMEIKGLDIPKHGEPAYPLESYGHGYTENITTVMDDGQLSSTHIGNQNGTVPDGKDVGPYESPEVKVMNNHADHHRDAMTAETTVVLYSFSKDQQTGGQVNSALVDYDESTAL